VTPAAIELANFRLVAQHLNNCSTAVPTARYLSYSFLDNGGRRRILRRLQDLYAIKSSIVKESIKGTYWITQGQTCFM